MNDLKSMSTHYRELIEEHCAELRNYSATSNGKSPVEVVARNAARFTFYLADLLQKEDSARAPRRAFHFAACDSLEELKSYGYLPVAKPTGIDELLDLDAIADSAVPSDEPERISTISSSGLIQYIHSFAAVLKRFSKADDSSLRKAYYSLTFIYESIRNRTSILQTVTETHKPETIQPVPHAVEYAPFSAIIGNEEAKKVIKTQLLYLLSYDEHTKQNPYLGIKNAVIQLQGVPGVGKSMILEAAARYVVENAEQFGVHPNIVRISQAAFDKYFGESERKLREAFAVASKGVTLVLMDEWDALCADRYSKDGSEARKSLTTTILQEMDTLSKRYNAHSLLLSATNLDFITDRALQDRTQTSLLLEGPKTGEEYAHLLHHFLKQTYGPRLDACVRITPEQLLEMGKKLAAQEKTYSTAAVHDIDLRTVRMSPRHLRNAILGAASKISGGFPKVILAKDVVPPDVIKAIKRGDYLSATDSELTMHKLEYHIKADHYARTMLEKKDFRQRVIDRASSLEIDTLAHALSITSHDTP